MDRTEGPLGRYGVSRLRVLNRGTEYDCLGARLMLAVEKTFGCLKCVAVVVYRSNLGREKVVEPVLSGGNFEGAYIIFTLVPEVLSDG